MCCLWGARVPVLLPGHSQKRSGTRGLLGGPWMRRRTRGPQSIPPAVHQEVGRGQGCSMGEEGTEGALRMALPFMYGVRRGQGGLPPQ